MLDGDWLMPLTASVMCVENDLPEEESVALTAAALILNGPLALAPALVAVERHRSRLSARHQQVDGGGPVGPALVEVPDLVSKKVTIEDAITRLDGLGLKHEVSRNVSEAADDGRVIAQREPPTIGSRVEEGTRIALKVGAGPAPAVQRRETLADLRTDMDAGFAELKALIIRAAGNATNVATGNTPAPSPPDPSPTHDPSPAAGQGAKGSK